MRLVKQVGIEKMPEKGMMVVAVDCRFFHDGSIEVKKVQVNEQWLAVEQGRQWVDRVGRHVLVKIGGGPVQELWLRADTMTWVLRPSGRPPRQVV